MAKVTKAALTRLVENAVANGVQALDRYFEDYPLATPWRDRINVRTLDTSDIMVCPMGQVFGGYGDGLRTLFGASQPYYALASRYGFNVMDTSTVRELLEIETVGWYLTHEQDMHMWGELDRLWRKAVRTGPPVNAATQASD